MLKDDQINKILEHCETLIGYPLNQIRGNLRSIEHRSAAIFELIVIDQLSEIGKIEYESRTGQSPDIKIIFESGDHAWIEIAFLYPKFWKEDQKREELDHSIAKEAQRRKIPPETIQIFFYHIKDKNGKPKQILPELHQIKNEVKNGFIKDFFGEIEKSPNKFIEKESDIHHFKLQYDPQKKGDFKVTISTVMESTSALNDNSLYRVLKSKCKQHKIKDEPRLILVGTDNSPSISQKFGSNKNDEKRVIEKIFKNNTSISGILLVRIDPDHKETKGTESNTAFYVYNSNNARNILTDEMKEALSKIDFKKWRYYNPIDKFESSHRDQYKNTSSPLKTYWDDNGPVMEMAERTLIDIISGKTSLHDEFPIFKSKNIKYDPFKNIAHLREVSFIEENLREGKPRVAVLKFTDIEQ